MTGGGAHTGAYENIDTPTAPPHTEDQHQSYEQSHPQPYNDGEKHWTCPQVFILFTTTEQIIKHAIMQLSGNLFFFTLL